MSDKAVAATRTPAFRLLQLEQSEFERFLHDDLGQCLVAIRSMAKAIEGESDREVAELIAQAADDAYIEAYDRMMELRAESLASEPVLADAIHQCIDDARLEAQELAQRVVLGDAVDEALDPVGGRLLLRGLRCILGVVKRVADRGGELVVDIDRSGNSLSLSVSLEPNGFPDTLYDHPRLERLENRLRECGGELLRESHRAPGAIQLRLPCGDLHGDS